MFSGDCFPAELIFSPKNGPIPGHCSSPAQKVQNIEYNLETHYNLLSKTCNSLSKEMVEKGGKCLAVVQETV
jgi:hypothetical protein